MHTLQLQVKKKLLQSLRYCFQLRKWIRDEEIGQGFVPMNHLEEDQFELRNLTLVGGLTLHKQLRVSCNGSITNSRKGLFHIVQRTDMVERDSKLLRRNHLQQQHLLKLIVKLTTS